MDLELSGRKAIVTGASRGLGRAIAQRLAGEGCDLAICARGEAALRAAADELRATGRTVWDEACDLTEAGAAEGFVERAAGALGGLDILINNVGGNRRGAFTEHDDAAWDAILDLNFRSHARCARAAVPHLERPPLGEGIDGPVRRDAGVIVFVASIFGREAGGAGLSLYNATKSALISLAKIVSLEVAARGIRVLSVAPGSIRFPGGSWDRRCADDPRAMEAFVQANLPIGRFGTAEEVADAVAFLASPRASLITGACVTVDGGQSRSLI